MKKRQGNIKMRRVDNTAGTAVKKICITALVLGLSACAAQTETDRLPPETEVTAQAAQTPPPAPQPVRIHIEKTVEIAYRCAQPKDGTLRVLYGIGTNSVLAAQIAYGQNITPILWREGTRANENAFYGDGLRWTTQLGGAAQLAQLEGDTLMQIFFNAQGQIEKENILAQNCRVDRRNTEKLAKQAEERQNTHRQ